MPWPYGLSKGSLASLEVVNALSFVLLLFFSYRLLSLFEVQAGRFAVLLLAASPVIVGLYSQLEAEPLMTTFGIMGLYYALRAGFADGRRRFFFISGLCLGMSFALKLWLFGPLALAIAAALGPVLVGEDASGLPSPAGPPSVRASLRRLLQREKLLAVGAFGLGAIIPAGLHLAAIGWYYPADMGFWLKDIYFGFFTGQGVSGTKSGGPGVPADWVHPVWSYAAVLYRDHFFLLPILLLGLGAVFRDERLKGKVLWALLAGIAGLLPALPDQGEGAALYSDLHRFPVSAGGLLRARRWCGGWSRERAWLAGPGSLPAASVPACWSWCWQAFCGASSRISSPPALSWPIPLS